MANEPQVEERDVSAEEIAAGVRLKAGHRVVLILGGTGHGRRDEPGEPDAPPPAPPQPAEPEAPPAPEPTPHDALDVQVVSAAGAPQKLLEFEVTLPDGGKRAGKTDDSGAIRLAGLPSQAQCVLDLPDVPPPRDGAPPAAAGRVRYQPALQLQAGSRSVVELPERVRRGRLTGLHFETAKTFLLPSAMPGIRQLKALYDSYGADLAVLVSGHTDTVYTAEYNRGLSNERADSMARFLTDDVDGWMKFYDGQPHSDPWGVREDQHMLSTLLGEQLQVDGKLGPKTQAAYKKFQGSKGLKETGLPNRDTRRALVTDYMAQDNTSLPKGAKLSSHGCGFTHLAVPTPPNTAEPQNRRVEIYLFEGEVAPPPQATCPAGGCAEYPQWVAKTESTVDLDQPAGTLRVQVLDPAGQGIDGAQVHASGPLVFDKPAPGGSVSFADAIPGDYKVVATADGFDAADAAVTVASGAEAAVTLSLKGLTFDLDVLVQDGASPPSPLAGAQVTVDVPGAAAQTTGPSGKVRFGGLRAGKVHVTASRKGFATAEADVQLGKPAPAAPKGSALVGDGAAGGTEEPTVSLQLLAAAPVIKSFQGTRAVKSPPPPSDFVFFRQGESIALSWTLEGEADKIVLDPGSKDVSGKTGIELNPAIDPPDADGKYTLVASSQGLASPPATLVAAGVLEYFVEPSDNPFLTPPSRLFDHDGKNEVPRVDGEAGSFNDAKIKSGNFWHGQVTPRTDIHFRWKVTAPAELSLELEVLGQGKHDLSANLQPDGTGAFELSDKAVLLMEANLNLTRKSSGAKLGSSVLVLRENVPHPGIVLFEALENGVVVPKGGKVKAWKDLKFHWKLQGDFAGNELKVFFKEGPGEKGKLIRANVLKPAGSTKSEDTTAAEPPPLSGHLFVDARLINQQGKPADAKLFETDFTVDPEAVTHRLTVRVRDANGPLAGAQVTAIDKTGLNHKAGPTLASGEVTLPAVNEGDVSVIVEAPGFKQGIQSIDLKKDDAIEILLVPAPAPNASLEAFIKFEAWDVGTRSFVALPNMTVEAVDDSITGDDVLDTQTTGAGGVAHFVVSDKKRPPGKAVDLVFKAKPAGRVIGGVTFPAEWSTKGWKSPGGTPGMQKGFKGSVVGSAGAPVVFRVGVDFHLRIEYEFTRGGAVTRAAAVQGVGVELQRIGTLVRNVGRFRTDAKGEVHGLTFLPAPGDALRVDVDGSIENPAINLPRASFRAQQSPESSGPDFWRSAKDDPDSRLIEDNRETSIGTQAAPAVFKGVGSLRAGCMYIFKVISEWSQFLFHVTDGLWKGIEDLKIFPHTAGGTSYSFPVGHVNFEPSDFFDRGTIAHEMSHQIMWKESEISSSSIVGKVLTGRLHLHHTEDLLSPKRTHPLIEGWAELIEAIFTGRGYSVGTLRTDVDKPPVEKLGPPPLNRGEFCEGAFANGLFDVYRNFVKGEQVLESADGNSFKPWMDDPDVRRRWKSAIWAPLQDLRSKSPPETHHFLEKIRSMHPSEWHRIVPALHRFNLIMDPPAISSIAPPSAPPSATLTITGSEFAQGETVVTFDGVEVVADVVDAATLKVRAPSGDPKVVKVAVKTAAGTSAAVDFTRTK